MIAKNGPNDILLQFCFDLTRTFRVKCNRCHCKKKSRLLPFSFSKWYTREKVCEFISLIDSFYAEGKRGLNTFYCACIGGPSSALIFHPPLDSRPFSPLHERVKHNGEKKWKERKIAKFQIYSPPCTFARNTCMERRQLWALNAKEIKSSLARQLARILCT